LNTDRDHQFTGERTDKIDEECNANIE